MNNDEKDNHFLQLGFGMNTYFNTLMKLGIMFILITIFASPLFVIYSSGQDVSQESGNMTLRKFAVTMLGNFGGSTVKCSKSPIKESQLSILCPIETYINFDEADYGIISMSDELSFGHKSQICLTSVFDDLRE
jgi:hypothetical protein